MVKASGEHPLEKNNNKKTKKFICILIPASFLFAGFYEHFYGERKAIPKMLVLVRKQDPNT